MKVFKIFVMCAVSLVAFTSCNETKKENSEEAVKETIEVVEEVKETPTTPNIVGVAAGNEAFSTLVAAVKAAGLVETLSGEGPFTVFAPTNDAFGKLPEGTVESLLKPASKDQLTAVLTYHVVAGKFEASAVIEAINGNDGKFTVDTVQGGKIDLSLNNGSVTLTDANGNTSVVVIPDVAASNGVIHAIDTVVMPK
ncbi:fasciclin domain-containing protein [uncultured Winogradskyella sp.]|uniref:fasciclin domain-containing protein n=1 Tax=uncultured Winogradskyella sp. TaxID=395353 RepID=UPI0026172076|nr:fasciclin domain-containing protein [uncultured Winogradskyella sp.]